MAFRVDGVIAQRSQGDLQSLDSAAYFDRATALVRELSAATAIGDAQRVYERLLPVEVERVRRAAAARLAAGERPLDVLFVLVGAQPDAPTLAVVASPAQRVVLLHTSDEARQAVRVCEDLELNAGEAVARTIGDGKSALLVYQAIWNEWESLGRPAAVGVDVTGGLKIMSAAAAAAAFAIPGASVFYIDSTQIRIERRVFNCEERRILLHNPFEVFGEIRRDVARRLLQGGRFDAAAAAYEELRRSVWDSKADEIRELLARAYAARVALDFAGAARGLTELASLLDRLAPQMPDDPVVQEREALRAQAAAAERLARFARRLDDARATDPGRSVEALRDPVCRDLIVLLLSAADRRIADREFDVAALLAYRATELIVQRRLALLAGADTAQLDWAALARACSKSRAELVEAYNAQVEPMQRIDPESPPREIARGQAHAVLRAAFPGDVADIMTVRSYAGLGKARNVSLLAHGLQQMSEKSTRDLRELAEAMLTRMFDREDVSAAERAALLERHRFIAPAR